MTDGVGQDVVEKVLDPGPKRPNVPADYSMHFVWGCPICMPAHKAFNAYLKTGPIQFDVKKKRAKEGEEKRGLLPEAMRARLLSDDYNTRLAALAELTRTWMERRLCTMRLTDTEREGWMNILKAGRKAGMSALLFQLTGKKRRDGENVGKILARAKEQNLMTACPFCDGAACSLDASAQSLFFQEESK